MIAILLNVFKSLAEGNGVPTDSEITRWVGVIALCSTIMPILNYNRAKKKDNSEDMGKFESRLDSLESSLVKLNNSVDMLTQQIQHMNERLAKNEEEEN